MSKEILMETYIFISSTSKPTREKKAVSQRIKLKNLGASLNNNFQWTPWTNLYPWCKDIMMFWAYCILLSSNMWALVLCKTAIFWRNVITPFIVAAVDSSEMSIRTYQTTDNHPTQRCVSPKPRISYIIIEKLLWTLQKIVRRGLYIAFLLAAIGIWHAKWNNAKISSYCQRAGWLNTWHMGFRNLD